MELRLRLLLLALICLHAPRWASAQQPEEATVIVKGSSRIAATDDNYVCATIDWWPPEKCNYNQCPWGQASILNLVEYMLYIYFLLLLLVGCTLLFGLTLFMPSTGPFRIWVTHFLLKPFKVGRRPFELHSVVASFIFVIRHGFILGPSRLVDCWLICSMSQTVFF
jgi:hypothetical protein